MTDQSDRAAFEEWYRPRTRSGIDLTKGKSDGYFNPQTELAWAAWQAALARERATAPAPAAPSDVAYDAEVRAACERLLVWCDAHTNAGYSFKDVVMICAVACRNAPAPAAPFKTDVIGVCWQCGGRLTSDHVCTSFVRPIPPEMMKLAEQVVEAQRNDTRTEEQRLADGVAFVMGPGGDEGTRFRDAPAPAAPAFGPEHECPMCRGSGEIIQDMMGLDKQMHCHLCRGTGRHRDRIPAPAPAAPDDLVRRLHDWLHGHSVDQPIDYDLVHEAAARIEADAERIAEQVERGNFLFHKRADLMDRIGEAVERAEAAELKLVGETRNADGWRERATQVRVSERPPMDLSDAPAVFSQQWCSDAYPAIREAAARIEADAAAREVIAAADAMRLHFDAMDEEGWAAVAAYDAARAKLGEGK